MRLKRFVSLFMLCAVMLLGQGLEPVLIPPASVEAVAVHQSELPPVGMSRLASLQDVINFQQRYQDRFELVMRWLLGNLKGAEYEQVIRVGAYPVDPTQAYVTMETVISSKGKSQSNTTVLMLRSPTVALTSLLGEGFEPSAQQSPWVEPSPPVTAEDPPCPFDSTKPDTRASGCYLVNNFSVNLNPGTGWTSPEGVRWKMERGINWFAPYNRWCPAN